MEYIKGVTFAPFSGRGRFEGEEVRRSFDRMLEGTGADFVIFVPTGLQDTAQSETIVWDGPHNVG